MSQVRFKRGTQSSLNTIKAGLGTTTTVAEGSFYLTTDTNRLYYANSASSLVELNQFVHIIDSGNLPNKNSGVEDGDIYYMSQPNILAIYKNGSWIQINPDTTLTPTTEAIGVTGVDGKAVIDFEVTDSNSVNASNSAKGAFTITGGDDINVSVSDNVITITSTATDTNTTYTVSTVTATGGVNLRLTDNNTPAGTQDILFKGDGGITVEKDGNDIKISGANPVEGVSNAFTAAGAFTTELAVSDGNDITSTAITPTIRYGGNETANLNPTAVFDGTNATTPTAVLDVYTTTEVDNLINTRLASFDAMTYKGTIADEAAAAAVFAATGANAPVAGDTYKVSNGFTFGSGSNIPSTLQGQTVHTGDLIIAGGSDSALAWDIVPSGDD